MSIMYKYIFLFVLKFKKYLVQVFINLVKEYAFV